MYTHAQHSNSIQIQSAFTVKKLKTAEKSEKIIIIGLKAQQREFEI